MKKEGFKEGVDINKMICFYLFCRQKIKERKNMLNLIYNVSEKMLQGIGKTVGKRIELKEEIYSSEKKAVSEKRINHVLMSKEEYQIIDELIEDIAKIQGIIEFFLEKSFIGEQNEKNNKKDVFCILRKSLVQNMGKYRMASNSKLMENIDEYVNIVNAVYVCVIEPYGRINCGYYYSYIDELNKLREERLEKKELEVRLANISEKAYQKLFSVKGSGHQDGEKYMKTFINAIYHDRHKKLICEIGSYKSKIG